MEGGRNMKGFTLMELLAAIAIVGVLSTAAVIMLGRTHVQTLQGKLESDVASLNRAVAVYVGFGGDLTAVEEPAEVLRRLKTRQSAVEAKSATGLTGQFLDSRWEADLMSEEEASSDRPRVVWDPVTQLFVVTSQGYPAVKGFSLGEPEGNEETEQREQVFSYAKQGQWIWDYQDRAPLDHGAPTEIPLSSGEDPIPVGEVVTRLLYPPAFATPGGKFSASDFPVSLVLTEGNPPGTAGIIYRIDGGPWTDYTGPITVPPGASVRAYSSANDPSVWRDSSQLVQVYEATPTVLIRPLISTSAPKFDWDGNAIVKVTVTDPNPAGSGLLFYSVGGSFIPYTGSFTLSVTEHTTSPAMVLAYVEPTGDFYLRSPQVTDQVDPPDTLSPPVAVGDPSKTAPPVEITPSGAMSGFVGLGWMNINGPLTVQAWDSATGLAASGSAWAVAQTKGPSNLNSGVSIEGELQTSGGVSMNGATVSKGLNALPAGFGNFPMPVTPPGAKAMGNYNGPAGGTETFPAGIYYFDSFTVPMGKTVIFSGPVEIYVNGSINLSGTVVTQGNLPSNLKIYNVSGGGVDIGSNPSSSLYASIYAPSSPFNLGGRSFYGSLITGGINVNSAFDMHIDVRSQPIP